MWGYIGIISGMCMTLAFFLTAIIIVLYKDLYAVYMSFKPSELKTVFYAFTFFLFAALTLAIFNLTALVSSTTYLYGKTDIPLFIHEISFIFYNSYFAIGLALLIYSDIKHRVKKWRVSLGIISFALSTGGTLFYTTMMYIKVSALIVALEALILLTLYIRHQEGENRFLSRKLWALSLLLIFVGRFINIFDLMPYAYLSTVYIDIFAFASLLILHIETEFKMREG